MTSSSVETQHWARRLEAVRARARDGRVDGRLTARLPLLKDAAASYEQLHTLMSLAQSLGELEVACLAAGRIASARPVSSVAEHNLAARLGEAGLPIESEIAAHRAFAKGGDAPETWLVLGRALQAQSRLNEADSAFAEALRRRPDYIDAHRDRVQLVWMRTGDVPAVRAALSPLEDLARSDVAAAVAVGNVLRQVVDGETAHRFLMRWRGDPDARLEAAAGAAASMFDMAAALRHYGAAVQLAPGNRALDASRSAALVAVGRPQDAEPSLRALVAGDPDDRYARALLDMALRELGSSEAPSASDHAREIGVYTLGDRLGEERAAWLGRVVAAVRTLHPFQAQPFDQSVQAGAQSASDPRHASDPALVMLFQEIEDRIRQHVATRGDDRWRIDGAWSVRLRAGGRHVDHVHPRGWLSSAVYIEVPEASSDEGRAAWLRFGAGRFGVFQQTALHWVRPEPGALVLFPSHFWHGTEPFAGQGERLTVAFDVIRL